LLSCPDPILDVDREFSLCCDDSDHFLAALEERMTGYWQ